MRLPRLWLVRHGETAWSLSGQHTGRTDIPLTAEGERGATLVGEYLRGRTFGLVLTSPLQRASETCRIAGYSQAAAVDPDLREVNYGAYEGRTTAEVRNENPGWSFWQCGAPGGESVHDVARRAERVLARVLSLEGAVALFSHGHFLRVLTACWLGLPPDSARLFALGTSSVSVLGHERESRVIAMWNRGFPERI